MRILLVDDHQMMRDGLRAILSVQTDIEVIGEADDGRSAFGDERRLVQARDTQFSQIVRDPSGRFVDSAHRCDEPAGNGASSKIDGVWATLILTSLGQDCSHLIG